MSTSPALPLMADGTLPAVPFLLRWLARCVAEHDVHQVRMERLPPGNGALPDLLASAGIQVLMLGHNPIGRPFTWKGWSGGRVLVGSDDPQVVQDLHHGELPWSADAGALNLDLRDALAAARLEDARAVSSNAGDTDHGATWDHLLDAVISTNGTPPASAPCISPHAVAAAIGHLGAWNPLALARRTVVTLPTVVGKMPQGLSDQRGVRHPVQLVDGPNGGELLVSVQLGALESVIFAALDEAVPGCHWEVSHAVIDNGRVRAELDALGQVTRLCCDGRFVDWSGPALQAMVGDVPLGGTAHIRVLEQGPVRARIAVTRVGERGTLQLIYSVHAHEPLLRVSASWQGDAGLRLDCPTLVGAAPLEVGGELAGWHLPQHARAECPTMSPLAGLRWARLCELDRQGLALLGVQPMTVSAVAGRLSLHVAHAAEIALTESAWPANAPGIAALALALSTPAQLTSVTSAPVLRLVGGDVVPWWIGRPSGWRGELLLGQPHGQRTRCTLYVAAKEAVRRDLRGGETAVRRTSDGDGFDIDLVAGELVTIRWR